MAQYVVVRQFILTHYKHWDIVHIHILAYLGTYTQTQAHASNSDLTVGVAVGDSVSESSGHLKCAVCCRG